MRTTSTLFISGSIVLLLAAGLPADALAATTAGGHSVAQPRVTTEKDNVNGRLLLNVQLHTPKEIDQLLTRAEKLSTTTRKVDNQPGIALVLHGDEVKIFNRENKKKYMDLIDKAARLDADQVIEIKVCRQALKHLNIKEDDVPGFVEIVPYGPDEEERLKKKGYIYL